jgi:hypothetical protein
MDQLGMTERGQPSFDPEEEVLIRAFVPRLKNMIKVELEAPMLNRENVSRFCWVVEMLEELAHGRPQRLREYMETR